MNVDLWNTFTEKGDIYSYLQYKGIDNYGEFDNRKGNSTQADGLRRGEPYADDIYR